MNYQKMVLLLLIPVVLTAASCCKKKVYCTSESFDFAFAGFERTEIKTFVLRRFAEGDQWGKPLDSAQYVFSGSVATTNKRDTIYLSQYHTAKSIGGIRAGNDWAIYLPVTGQRFFITSITEEDNLSELVKCNDDETSCTKKITSFVINNLWKSGDFTFIDKDEWKQ